MFQYGPYNKSDENEQWIRITEGCPHNHEFCYEPQKVKIFKIPEIVRNKVRIMDMNLLCKPEALHIISELGSKRVDGRVVYYELVCGIDWRFLTQKIAGQLHGNRFQKIRLAWDLGFKDQYDIVAAIKMLRKAGYKNHDDIMVFMVCNWKTSFDVNMRKLDLLKIWRCQVSDCWFDNQLPPNVHPAYWTKTQIKEFRSKCRKHNHLVTFGIDPEYKVSNDTQGQLF